MASNFDSLSGLIYEVKRPVEERTFLVDFSRVIAAGKTIESVDDVASSTVGLVEGSQAMTVVAGSITGLKVAFKASGGTDEEDYEVTILLTDSDGDVVSDDVMVKVRKAGKV